ncbi:GATA-type zinc finger protein 1 isoform X1 [Pangasianodon hypophthalmus]|uniref:GATA-type zinc finger protein 1 isoform X1 n=1 Tax=Pangasianodon hypophthalmus TaxID=310915 RepID=UPI000EFFA09E|nr:GATA-type zinc finger protein 1 isoform X1 [Pangasianodon hypophthalmus]XP_026789048.3 GATA-type zinc finger protein 1 isoform X1 [Pangasianodon hypophthalmus]
MSSEVNSPADLRNCSKTTESTKEDMDSEDVCMTQSSILYLLQEATKLVTPPKQHGLDVEKLHDGTKEMIVSHNSTSLKQKGQEVRTVKTQPSFTGAFSMLSSSPWEVMSLINLQCERLLHSGGTHGEEEESQTQKTKTDTKSEDRDVTREWSSFPSTGSASIVSMRTDTMEHAMESDVCCSVPHIIDPTDHLAIQSTSENSESAAIKAVEDLAELISKTTEDSLLSSRVMSEERTDHCFLVETSVLPLDLTKKVEICEHSIENGEGVNEMASVSSISEAPQSPEISSVDFTSSLVAEKYEDSCFSFNEGEKAECESALVSETPPSRADVNNNLEDETLQEAEKTSTQPGWGNRRRTPRKQAHPARSADLQDPGLQGVTFSMHTQLDHSTDQCRLLITSNYSKLCRRGRRSRSCRSRSLQNSQRTSSSEEESDSASLCKKICASCCTRKTPLWRDAEDGTPLCNACGIRYKKYRVRCLQCWNIPRKEASSNSKCLKCGDLLQLASQSKRAGW